MCSVIVSPVIRRARILVQVTINRRLLIGRGAISTNQKATIYRNFYENMGAGP